MGKKSNEVKKARHIDRPKDRNINNVHKKREKVFNDTDVNKTTILPKLKCFYTNADQLFNKLPELMVRTRDNKPDIIGITEVKNKNNRQNPSIAEYSIGEVGKYQMFAKNIDRGEGRGILLYTNNIFGASEVEMDTTFEENLFVNIKLNNNDKLLIGIIYRSPSNKNMEHHNQIRKLIQEASNKHFSHILIMGDFNYPNIDWENCNSNGDSTESIEYKFIENLQDSFLFQHIKKPTRWRGTNTPHILDLIITNEEPMISDLECTSPLGKSDHCVLSFNYNCYINIMANPRKQRSYDKGNYPDFMNELEQKDWSSILSEREVIDANWKKFVDILRSLQDKYIPKKIRRQLGKSKSNFPMDKKTREKIRKQISCQKRL